MIDNGDPGKLYTIKINYTIMKPTCYFNTTDPPTAGSSAKLNTYK